MLRDGVTGDWIGTFFKHKGAVYQARLSSDGSTAATASADFTARVWDTHTGEELYNLQHAHIVRAVAFPPNSNSLLATGGMEKKLRLFDLEAIHNDYDKEGLTFSDGLVVPAERGFEIGPGEHKGTIRGIVWTLDHNIIVTVADDKLIRWWSLATKSVVKTYSVHGDFGSCEFTTAGTSTAGVGGCMPVLVITAGQEVLFFGGADARTHLKTMTFPFDVASAAFHPDQYKLVIGSRGDTWVKVYDYHLEKEIDVHKGHHGPIWSIAFSPDGNLYATGSEDGTIKMWKNCDGPFGLWKSNGDSTAYRE